MMRASRVMSLVRVAMPRISTLWCGMAEEPLLDAFDREILRRVQLDARTTGEDIGADIGSPRPPCSAG